jgi:hypothetical protein
MTTRPETLDLLAVLRERWPHAKVAASSATLGGEVDEWYADLKDLPVEDCMGVLRQMNRQYPPTPRELASAVREALDGPPPSFEALMALHNSPEFRGCLPYRPEANPASDISVALENLTRCGAPEILLRLVASFSVQELRMLPDGGMWPLDLNQRAVRRDAARAYADRVVPDYLDNPTPGLALRRAVARYGPPDPALLLHPDEQQLRARQREQFVQRRNAPALSPAADDDDGEFVNPDQVRALLKQTGQSIAAELMQASRERRAVEQKLEAERQAALDELEEMRRRREAEAVVDDPPNTASG